LPAWDQTFGLESQVLVGWACSIETRGLTPFLTQNGIVRHEGNEYHFPSLLEEVLAILEDGDPARQEGVGKA